MSEFHEAIVDVTLYPALLACQKRSAFYPRVGIRRSCRLLHPNFVAPNIRELKFR